MARRKTSVVLVGILSVVLVSLLPASGLSSPKGSALPAAAGLSDLDAREGMVAPAAEQVAAAERLDARVDWNPFGTPQSMIRYGGYLGPGIEAATPVEAALAWVAGNRALLRLPSTTGLELVNASRLEDSDGYAILFQQSFEGLRAAEGGLLTVAVEGSAARGWKVAYVSSSLTPDATLSGEPTLSAVQAWLIAAADVRVSIDASAVGRVRSERDWSVFAVAGFPEPQRARLVAIPMPGDGARVAYETIVLHDDLGFVYQHYVDARTGAVLVRKDILEQAGEEEAETAASPTTPRWKVYPAYPELGTQTHPWGLPSDDLRETWCWQADPAGECDRVVENLASKVPWDYNPATGSPTFTTAGNNAITAEAWTSPLTPSPTRFQPVSPTRDYIFGWTNAWFRENCAPVFVPGQSQDISAAVTNLFVMHNRMHDWSYNLGFDTGNWNAQADNLGTGDTLAGDPIQGDVQAGAVDGGFPSYTGRDNANMATLPDGVPSVTNMYLWQQLPGALYAPCVDGDYDMAVIGHEYGHMIENRMIGKGNTRSGHHAGAMGESSGDLLGMEYLNEYGFVPVSNENPYSVGAYVTGNFERGIRNYGMDFPQTGAFPEPGVTPRVNPLNFSDMGYDLAEQQVHANGEIWSAVNFDIRRALNVKYEGTFPASDDALQGRCADGLLPADQCPGNRRWAQIMFDAYLLMPTNPSMLQARDAYLAADQMRFGGANQDELWLAFATRGFGEQAYSSNSSAETPTATYDPKTDPTPDFASPRHSEARVVFSAVASEEGGTSIPAEIFVGHYEARVSPIADTDPATAPPAAPAPGQEFLGRNLDDQASFVPGTYEFVGRANGYGMFRFRLTLRAGETRPVVLNFPTNWASRHKGAEASGQGVRLPDLVDDTESTNWAREGVEPLRGAQVTVDLAGTEPRRVELVNVSAMLRSEGGVPPVTAPAAQNRWSAVRQFEIQTCTASGANASCTADGAFSSVYTSPPEAFPGFNPRPVAPDWIMRSFPLPQPITATHLRLVVLENQCTGDVDFQREQDSDPLNDTDCREGNPGEAEIFGESGPQALEDRDDEVRIAELQVFSSAGTATSGLPADCARLANLRDVNLVIGTNKVDKLTGTAGPDAICGRRGKDRIRGLGEDDVLVGGRGKDRLVGGAGNDRMFAGGQDDLLLGGAGNDRLIGWQGDDDLRSGSGRDRMNGMAGRDVCRGGRRDAAIRCEAGR
jgi:extracellular elastinolytic metalloproteinase